MKIQDVVCVALALFVAGCGGEEVQPEVEPPEGSLTRASSGLESVSGSFSGLRMYRYVPDNVGPDAPLVVAMHGCTMSARDYEAAGWNALADEWGFYVLYPEQPGGTNRCFSWWDRAQTSRGSGEVDAIKRMVDRMKADYDIDPQKVFVTGLSAGGAMTAAMLATYPDVFAGGAVMAGLPYRCASSQNEGFSCMFSGKDLSPQQWASLALEGARGYSGARPRVSIWHGTGDYTVRDVNATALMRQWTGVHGVDQRADVVEQTGGAAHAEYHDAAGRPVVETWLISGMGHGTPVDPGFAPAGGCGRAGAFVLDVNLCSTYHAGVFFGLQPGGAPPEEPVDPPEEPVDPPEEPVDPPEEPVDPPEEPVDPPQDPVEPPEEPVEEPPAFVCQEFNASNYAHERAGRAYVCQGYACAKGSGQRMGLWNTFYTSWLRQTAAEYYELGRCP